MVGILRRSHLIPICRSADVSRNASSLGKVPVDIEPGKEIVRKYEWSQYFGMFPISKVFVYTGVNPSVFRALLFCKRLS